MWAVVCSVVLQLFVANVLGDPRLEMRDTRVHARVLAFAAAYAPRHDADLDPLLAVLHHQWTAGIALQKNDFGSIMVL